MLISDEDKRKFQKKFLNSLSILNFSEIFNSLPDVYYFAKDKEGRFVGINTALLKAIGFEKETDILGKTDYDIFDIRLSDRYREEDQIVMNNKEPLLDKIWHVPDGDGHLRWYLSSKTPLFDKQGQVTGIIGLMRDGSKAGAALGPYEDFDPILRYIHDHFNEQIAVPHLAKLFHASVSIFEKKFKRLFKLTPLQYINKVRLDSASDYLVKTNKSITEIANITGFYDHTYFAKRFKSEFAMTPKAYRTKYQN